MLPALEGELRSPLKVAIVGTTPSRVLAPYLDHSWEIWASSDPDLPRWTRWFEIHDPVMLERDFAPVWNWMVDQKPGRPIYMAQAHPDIQASEAFPCEKIDPGIDSMFLSSTVAWELALALALGASEIGIFGVDMSATEEYQAQKPGCRALVMLARARGVKITVPDNCELLKPVPTYQLGEQPWRLRQIQAQKAIILSELNRINEVVKAYVNEANTLRGGLEAMDFAERNWG